HKMAETFHQQNFPLFSLLIVYRMEALMSNSWGGRLFPSKRERERRFFYPPFLSPPPPNGKNRKQIRAKNDLEHKSGQPSNCRLSGEVRTGGMAGGDDGPEAS
ncbi:UNVERIFIED_CONTAM: hypothetical protein K2H54_011425, partial [Gekko kuhli]